MHHVDLSNDVLGKCAELLVGADDCVLGAAVGYDLDLRMPANAVRGLAQRALSVRLMLGLLAPLACACGSTVAGAVPAIAANPAATATAGKENTGAEAPAAGSGAPGAGTGARSAGTGPAPLPLRPSTPHKPTGKWAALNDSSALTPPMGWASWNAFHLDIDEARIRGVAQAMVAKGYRDAGYRQVNIDDGWWLKRRQSDSRLVIETGRFPSALVDPMDATRTSFKPLTDYLHSLGLKAGIYSDTGWNSCGQLWDQNHANLPQGTQAEREVGTFDHTLRDMQLLFGEWGFDYLKLDSCGILQYTVDQLSTRGLVGRYRTFDPLNEAQVRHRYQEVAEAIALVGRPAVLSVCVWGQAAVNDWGSEVGHVWRTSGDIRANWGSLMRNHESTADRELYAGPNRWNDPDMLFVGKGEFDATHVEQARAHLSLWAMHSAPLLIGADLRHTPPAIDALMLHPGMIAIDQNPGGHQATRVVKEPARELLVKTLTATSCPGVEKAVLFLNRSNRTTRHTASWQELALQAGSQATVVDVWSGKALRSGLDAVEVSVPARGVRMLRVCGVSELARGRYLGELPGLIHVAAQGQGTARVDRASSGGPLQIAGQRYARGLGVHADSLLQVRLDGKYRRFSASAGVDDAASSRAGRVWFAAYGDGRRLWQSPVLRAGDAPLPVQLDVCGIHVLELIALGQGDATAHVADWVDPVLER